jgi:hypothetical protein
MRRLAAVYFTYLLAAHFLVGCAALGVPAADTFNKKAAGAVQTVNAASQLTLTLLQARKITPDENDAYIDRCEEAQSAIDLTRQLYVTDPTGATDRLAQIIAGLTVLTAELERRR